MDKIYKFFEFLEKKEKRDIPVKLKLLHDPNYKFDINDFKDEDGNIDLSGIKKDFKLPDNLSVGRDLYLSNTSIKSLPDNLEVNGGLHLINTPIKSLPDNLKVGRNLDLAYTNIESLPDNLKVGGGLYLEGTPLATKLQDKSQEELKQLFPGVEEWIII